jgi:hypothetical protein
LCLGEKNFTICGGASLRNFFSGAFLKLLTLEEENNDEFFMMSFKKFSRRW